jgi:serine/threonine protein phosphatase PrpC
MGGSQAKLLLVADGVGGNPAGDQASRLAVQGIVQYLLNTMHWLFRLNDGREDAFLEDLKGALAFTQEKIRQNAQADASHLQMGTTITLAYIVWPHVYLIHVGDSRAYVVRDQKVIHLTHDQTYAQALVDAGMMNESDLRKSPLRHVLSGLVGCDSRHLTPEVNQFNPSSPTGEKTVDGENFSSVFFAGGFRKSLGIRLRCDVVTTSPLGGLRSVDSMLRHVYQTAISNKEWSATCILGAG